MLLRLTFLFIGQKYYIMYYCPSLPNTVFSNATLVTWNQLWQPTNTANPGCVCVHMCGHTNLCIFKNRLLSIYQHTNNQTIAFAFVISIPANSYYFLSPPLTPIPAATSICSLPQGMEDKREETTLFQAFEFWKVRPCWEKKRGHTHTDNKVDLGEGKMRKSKAHQLTHPLNQMKDGRVERKIEVAI